MTCGEKKGIIIIIRIISSIWGGGINEKNNACGFGY